MTQVLPLCQQVDRQYSLKMLSNHMMMTQSYLWCHHLIMTEPFSKSNVVMARKFHSYMCKITSMDYTSS